LTAESFDNIKASFWSDSTYGVLPPLTDEAIREAEQLLDVRLPDALLELLRLQNGGGVADDRCAFPTIAPTSWADDHVPFEDLMGIGRSASTTTLLTTPYLVGEWGLPEPVVLLTGDGHYWIGLDYRECGRTGEPSVTWFDTDLETELALAPDFRRFVEGLLPAERFDESSAGARQP
jgi:hypothetical protein